MSYVILILTMFLSDLHRQGYIAPNIPPQRDGDPNNTDSYRKHWRKIINIVYTGRELSFSDCQLCHYM